MAKKHQWVNEAPAHLKQIAERMARAHNNFIELLMEAGGISEADAELVLKVYTKAKIVKVEIDRISVKHGGFWERAAIHRALA